MAQDTNKKKVGIATQLLSVVRALRPVHWTKNLALFAALIFSRNLLHPDLFFKTIVAFVAFSLAASAGYIFNDIKDAKSDKLHPIKRNRPIASGKLDVPLAFFVMVVLIVLSLHISINLSYLFFISVLTYIVIQFLYSLFLKNIPVIDILIIASGFILRVYAGAFVIDAHLSVWFLLCVISTALFLASGKRRAELGAMRETKIETRKSLTKYPKALLDSYVTMFGNAAWMSWSLFTFFESPSISTPVWLFLAEVSRAVTISKLLMITIPFTIFGIMRYESLIFQNRSEAPEKLLLTDIPLIASLSAWVILVVGILYGTVTNI